jgi:hypothetical protein
MRQLQHWHVGDDLVLIYRDRSEPATVILASPNGRSLLLSFDALLGNHAGAMPVLADDDGEFWSAVSGEPVILSVKPAREA